MDKKKQIEEMAKDVELAGKCTVFRNGKIDLTLFRTSEEIAETLYNLNYHKIPENAVVLTEKEYNRYARIEKIIKLAKREKAIGYEVKNGKLYYFSNLLEGFEHEFKDLLEICDTANHYNEEFYGLDQRLTFWKGKAETTAKETAEKFAPLRKYMWDRFHHYHDIRNKAEADYKKCKDENGKAVLNNDYHRADAIMFILGKVLIEFDEIYKEITEGKA